MAFNDCDNADSSRPGGAAKNLGQSRNSIVQAWVSGLGWSPISSKNSRQAPSTVGPRTLLGYMASFTVSAEMPNLLTTCASLKWGKPLCSFSPLQFNWQFIVLCERANWSDAQLSEAFGQKRPDHGKIRLPFSFVLGLNGPLLDNCYGSATRRQLREVFTGTRLSPL
jgi:hypothetical protein